MANGWGSNVQAFDSRDSSLEISKGNVQGHNSLFVTMESDFINPTFQTVWGVNADFVWPTGDEAWEVVSDSANDTSAGTGARTVLIEGLDTNFATQTEIVTLNGTTPVATTRTDWNRISLAIVVTAGSNESNVGELIIRVASAGNVRTIIAPTFSRSFNGFFTIPLGKTAFLRQNVAFTPKGEDIIIQPRVMGFSSGVWITAGRAATYQSSLIIANISLPVFPEKTDIEFRAKSTNTGVSISIGIEITLVDAPLAECSVMSMEVF